MIKIKYKINNNLLKIMNNQETRRKTLINWKKIINQLINKKMMCKESYKIHKRSMQPILRILKE